MIEHQYIYAILRGKKFKAINLPTELLAQVEDYKANDTAAIIESKIGENGKNTEGSRLLNFLNFLIPFKAKMKEIGVTQIAIYHTVAYSGQCNFEYNPKEIAALKKLKATLCPSAYEQAVK